MGTGGLHVMETTTTTNLDVSGDLHASGTTMIDDLDVMQGTVSDLTVTGDLELLNRFQNRWRVVGTWHCVRTDSMMRWSAQLLLTAETPGLPPLEDRMREFQNHFNLQFKITGLSYLFCPTFETSLLLKKAKRICSHFLCPVYRPSTTYKKSYFALFSHVLNAINGLSSKNTSTLKKSFPKSIKNSSHNRF